MGALSRERLIELFYDAALAPELWGQALEGFADLVGGGGLALLSADRPDKGIWLRNDPAARRLFESRFQVNPIALHVYRLRQQPDYRPVLLTDEEIMSKGDYYRSEYFNDFMRPYDGDALIGLDLGKHGVSAALNISRTLKAGPFTADALRMAHSLHGDLIRAFWMSVRLGLSGARDASLIEVMDRSEHGFLLLDETGDISHANPAATAVLSQRDGLLAERNRLTAELAEDRVRLQRAIRNAVTAEDDCRSGSWLAVRRAPPAPALKLTVSPLGLDRPALFEVHARAMVCVIDAAARLEITVDQLKLLFGLTLAQARMALKLAVGLDVRAAAEELGISVATARTHLYAILAKTNTGRQSELIGLLSRLQGGYAI